MTQEEVDKFKPGDFLFINDDTYCFIEQHSKYFIKCQHLIGVSRTWVFMEVVLLNIMFHNTIQSKILKNHCK